MDSDKGGMLDAQEYATVSQYMRDEKLVVDVLVVTRLFTQNTCRRSLRRSMRLARDSYCCDKSLPCCPPSHSSEQR